MAERFTAHPRFPGLWETEVTRQRGDGRETTRDWISVEEPLSVSVDEDVLATTMRTPGSDRELALGLLFAESVINCRGDIGSVSHCGRPKCRATADPGTRAVARAMMVEAQAIGEAIGVRFAIDVEKRR